MSSISPIFAKPRNDFLAHYDVCDERQRNVEFFGRTQKIIADQKGPEKRHIITFLTSNKIFRCSYAFLAKYHYFCGFYGEGVLGC